MYFHLKQQNYKITYMNECFSFSWTSSILWHDAWERGTWVEEPCDFHFLQESFQPMAQERRIQVGPGSVPLRRWKWEGVEAKMERRQRADLQIEKRYWKNQSSWQKQLTPLQSPSLLWSAHRCQEITQRKKKAVQKEQKQTYLQIIED